MVELNIPILLLSLVTTGFSLFGLWLQGSKRVEGFYLGIANQFLWFALALATGVYGLLPNCFIYGAVYWRNIRRWRADNAQREAHT